MDITESRFQDVIHFWATDDPAQAQAFLAKYGVQYVYIGPLERQCYMTDAFNACLSLSSQAIAKFAILQAAHALTPVYSDKGVIIYKVT